MNKIWVVMELKNGLWHPTNYARKTKKEAKELIKNWNWLGDTRVYAVAKFEYLLNLYH